MLTYYATYRVFPYFVITDVYTKGRKTLYSFIGIFWNYFYIIGIFVILFVKMNFDFTYYKKYLNIEQQKADQPATDEQKQPQEIEMQAINQQ